MNNEQVRKTLYLKVFKKIVYKDPLTKEDKKVFSQWKESYNPNMELFHHYKKKEVLYEIVKHLGNNELCYNNNIRWLYAAKVESLIYSFYFYGMFENKGTNNKGEKITGLTMYKGLLNYNKRTPPPYNPKTKKEWQDNEWTKDRNYLKNSTGYDFGIDLDGKNFNDSYNDAKKIFNLFNEHKIKYSVWCSGKKGFHFIIPYEEFKQYTTSINDTINACKALAEDISELLKLKKIDYLIYSPTRFLKCPWSIDSRNGKVILPLDNKEFIDFKKNQEEYTSTKYCHQLKGLGRLTAYRGRNTNKEGFKKMIQKINKEL